MCFRVKELSLKLYHRVPDNLKYDEIMSLNQLELIDQELFDSGNWKYLNRPELKKIKIPTLNCLWNDVIFMSPVHPAQIKKALEDSGIEVKQQQEWFEICPQDCGFNSFNSTIFMYSSASSDSSDLNEYRSFSIDNIKSLNKLKPEVTAYYKECAIQGAKPMVFHLIPHVMHKGKLSLDKLSIILV